jgi:hypothetical protein
VTARRELGLVVLVCAAAAGLALLAAGRTWAVEVTVRPPPLGEVRVARTGGGLAPWLPALGWAGLAGAGALLATRAGRRVVGVLLLLAGAGVVGTAILESTMDGDAGGAWPAVTGLAGLVLAGTGGWAALRGPRWPGLGSRYERPAVPERAPAQPVDMWRAIDRGEDPTAHPVADAETPGRPRPGGDDRRGIMPEPGAGATAYPEMGVRRRAT